MAKIIQDATLKDIADAIREQDGTIEPIKVSEFNNRILKLSRIPNNILPSDLIWNTGYFSSNGGIVSASATNKEKYETEYIEVEPNTFYFVLIINMTEKKEGWCGICYYDSEKNFISRNSMGPYASNEVTRTNFTVPATAKYIRVSLRTYDGVYFGICKMDEIDNMVKVGGDTVTLFGEDFVIKETNEDATFDKDYKIKEIEKEEVEDNDK